jgi:aspartyl-tRNA(Asn)/glutamyl-tRNA(Gln) amidotransferase subunit B
MSAMLETIIGLEVHAQIRTKTKLFCSCPNGAWDAPPNTTVCPICMGHPGTLPVPNAEALRKAICTSLALGCTIAPQCHFDRKHYFYPDLPSGFQISQYDFPLAKHGHVDYDLYENSGKPLKQQRCRIHRLHVENDAGKLTHVGCTTLCDYNRAGTPLMEIVTEPDLRSAEEAVAFAQELRRILLAVDASEADMFKGMMRFDASISLREQGTEKLNPRSEIKNLNSFKALEKALQYEENRLRDAWEKSGGPLPGNITVGWLDDAGRTRLLREKEDAQDYRYFPEPDIPPMAFETSDLETIKAALPPLPKAQREAYVKLGLEEASALQLLGDPILKNLFDALYAQTQDAKLVAGILLTQLLGFLNAAGKTTADTPSTEHLRALVEAIQTGTISKNSGKALLEQMVQTGQDPHTLMAKNNMQQVSDAAVLERLVKDAIAANPDAVASFKKGKTTALGAIVGFVMKQSKGQANPGMVNELMLKSLQAEKLKS